MATLMSCTSFQAQILHENNKLPRPDGHENCTTQGYGDIHLEKGPTKAWVIVSLKLAQI